MNNKLKTSEIAIAVPLFGVPIGMLSLQTRTWDDIEFHISPSEIYADRWNSETNEYSTDIDRRTGNNSCEMGSTIACSGDWKCRYGRPHTEFTMQTAEEIRAQRLAAATLSELARVYESTRGYMGQIYTTKRWRQFE